MTNYLAVEGGRIAYDVTGDSGPPVVMAPGIGDVRAEYRFLAPSVAAGGYRVASMDLRGHGESSAGWAEHTPESVGRDMLALVRELGDGPAVLVGTSMAAASVVWAAVEAPDQVAAILLLGPSVRDAPMTPAQRIMFNTLLAGPWRVRAWVWFYGTLYPGAKPADLDAYRHALRANLAEPGRFAAAAAFLAASKAQCTARLAAVQAPALVVMGERDPDYPDPAAEAAWIAGQLRAAETFIVPAAGHYPHVDHPAETAARVLQFLHPHLNQATPSPQEGVHHANQAPLEQ
jgi:pimeloyl-ACP methyl ester carboxylesterase